MQIMTMLNSPMLYLICGSIIAFVAVVCLLFALKAYKAGKEIGMDETKMKRSIIASITFTILPSIGILLGVIALSGSLGTPWPWLRLSVIGALHYETQVAEAAAEASGISPLSGSHMTAQGFVNIALLMSACIIWGIVLSIFTNKAYTSKLTTTEPKKKKSSSSDFGNIAMNAMFIGLVSAYIASYIATFVSGNGSFTFQGSYLSLAVAIIAGLVMAIFIYIRDKGNMAWIDSFSIAGSMLIAMICAIFLSR